MNRRLIIVGAIAILGVRRDLYVPARRFELGAIPLG